MKPQKIHQAKNITRAWREVDASQQTLGRVASQIALLLRGKHKRDFTPHLDMGDFVVAVNVDKLKLTGRKIAQKKYYRHSGFLGGLKVTQLKDVFPTKPEWVLKQAVTQMLDDVKFRKTMISRLKFVKGSSHNYPTK